MTVSAPGVGHSERAHRGGPTCAQPDGSGFLCHSALEQDPEPWRNGTLDHHAGRSGRWRDLSPFRQKSLGAASFIQLTLAVAAWADLNHRASCQVRGPKWCWAFAIAVNFVGPITYFFWGIRRPYR